jgi:hypothetical protein
MVAERRSSLLESLGIGHAPRQLILTLGPFAFRAKSMARLPKFGKRRAISFTLMQ